MSTNINKLKKGFNKFKSEYNKSILLSHELSGKIIESEYKKDYPESSGLARRSIKYNLETKKGIINRVTTTVSPDSKLPYVYTIEEGRKKGTFPNLEGIKDWLARRKDIQESMNKFFDNGNKKKKKKSNWKTPIKLSSRFDDLSSYQKSKLFIIARGIKNKGIKGKKIAEKIREEASSIIDNVFSSEISKVLKNFSQ